MYNLKIDNIVNDCQYFKRFLKKDEITNFTASLVTDYQTVIDGQWTQCKLLNHVCTDQVVSCWEWRY